MKTVNKSKVNPSAPVFLLKIGDTDFTLQNNELAGEYVISFSMNRSAEDMANDIKVRLFDQTAFIIEWYIVQGYKKITFRYGMDESNLSKEFVANIKDYELEFTGSGHLLLDLDLQLGEITDGASSEVCKEYKANTPSDVIYTLAKEEGWTIGKVVSTKPIPGQEYFLRESSTPQDFVINKLIPNAVSTTGKTDYTFYLDTDGMGKTIVYFMPKGDSLDFSNVKTYEIVIGGGGSGDDNDTEVVISFSPSYNGVLQAILGANGDTANNNIAVDVPSLDSLTNNIVGAYNNDGIKRVIGSSSYTNGEAGRIAEYMWTKMSALDNTAQLVLRGDASFTVQAFVVIVVLTPEGFFHHSSGLYQVLEVSDDIEGGLYTTTLNLVKRTLVINEDGSINPGEPVSYKYKDDGTIDTSNIAFTGGSLQEQTLRSICDAYNGCKYSQQSRLGTSSYDCSSLVNVIMGDMGIPVNWSTTADGISKRKSWGSIVWESGSGKALTIDMIKPGYIGCYNSGGKGHTWIFMNSTTIFHASSPTKGVLYDDKTAYWVDTLNSKPSGRAVVWSPPPSSSTPIKNNGVKSRNNTNL